MFNTTVTDLLFANDVALGTCTSEDMQALLNNFVAACTAFGLKTSEMKTIIMCQAVADHLVTEEPQIKVNSKKLAVVDQFCYLGSHVTNIMDILK